MAPVPLLLLASLAAAEIVPKAWERKTVPDSTVSVLVPAGSIEQPRGRSRPGFDEVEKGWLLQSLTHHEGASRFILYLAAGSIMVAYHRDDTLESYETLDIFMKSHCTGAPWGEDQTGKWKGFRTRTVGRKVSDKLKDTDPYGVIVAYGVAFGPTEYLVIKLEANPNAISRYLPYFVKIRDSLQYARP